MQDLGWRPRWGSCPAARRGARQRAGLTPASAFNTLSCLLEMLHSKQLSSSKCWLTVMTVSTASCASRSWCGPAGESPAQVRGSTRLVASVAWLLATLLTADESCSLNTGHIEVTDRATAAYS